MLAIGRLSLCLCVLSGQVLTISALADEAPAASWTSADPRLGECVTFHEGGVGLIFKSPTFWLKGSVAGFSRERRMAGRCPKIGKSVQAYTRDDWARVAASLPCVHSDADVREVTVLRIRVAVEEWETPWSNMHGTVGWLFRGHFLDKPLVKGEQIDLDASWLERCEP